MTAERGTFPAWLRPRVAGWAARTVPLAWRWLLPALLILAGASCSQPIDSLAPITAQGAAISDFFNAILVLSALVFALVAGWLAYVVVRYRGPGVGPAEEPVQTPGNRRLEIAWTAAPLALVAVLFLYTVRVMATVDAPYGAPLHIQVIGHQWWWEYRYPDRGVVTANELHVPVGRPLRLDLDAADVVHSFWVPHFGWKRDAVPGKTNVIWATVEREGNFEGDCTEFCGLQHAWMRTRVVAEPSDQFDAWIAAQLEPAAAPQSDLARRGGELFQSSSCRNCHTVRGTAATAQVGPDLTHVASRSLIGGGVLSTSAENLARFFEDAPGVKPGVLMPSFLSMPEADRQAIAAYLQGLH